MREIALIIALVGLTFYGYKLDKSNKAKAAQIEQLEIENKNLVKQVEETLFRLTRVSKELEQNNAEVVAMEIEAQEAKDAEDAADVSSLLARHSALVDSARRNKDRYEAQSQEIESALSRNRSNQYSVGRFVFDRSSLRTEAEQRAAYEAEKSRYLSQLREQRDALYSREKALESAYYDAQKSVASQAAGLQSQIRRFDGYKTFRSPLY